MPITDWPKEDRPREKLLNKGPHALTDAELVAILLQSGTTGKTALDIAKALLAEQGGLGPLINAPPHIVMQRPGVGPAKYAAMLAAVELGNRYHNAALKRGKALTSRVAAQRFLASRLRKRAQEVFAAIFLDNGLRVICYEELFYGTINETAVYPREIVKCGLKHNAAKIILAHNHPSGRAMPSHADKEVTYFVQQALALVHIDLIDHIIIGAAENFSFAKAELLSSSTPLSTSS